MRKALLWAGAVLGAVILIIVLVLAFIDEPLRAYAERQLNRRVEGYTFRIGKLDFHPVKLGVELKDITVVQKKHPDPPVAQLAKWRAGLQWGALLSGRIVSDHEIERPVLRITRPQAKEEAEDEKPAAQKSWQEDVLALYPVTVNKFEIADGDVTYIDHPKARPLHVGHLNFHATNIRNVKSEPNVYPSDVRLEATLFGSGTVTVDGKADFFSEPYPGVHADFEVNQASLDDLVGILGRYHIQLRKGLLSAIGHTEFSPRIKAVKLDKLKMQGVRLDYVYAAETKARQKETAQKAAETAKQAAEHPQLLIRIEQGLIENSEFGFVNKSAQPDYRVFLTGTDIHLENFSNRLSEGTATIRLRGMFMGNGAATVVGHFRPETQSPDFDLNVQIFKTKLKSMNDLLRAYGDFDVTSGVFSIFSEIAVKNGKIDGYMKPLFKDVEVYEPAQDRDKALLQKVYEAVIGGITGLLKNEPREEVATKAEISGPVENPQAATWDMVLKLIRNAFFEAILPGLERRA